MLVDDFLKVERLSAKKWVIKNIMGKLMKNWSAECASDFYPKRFGMVNEYLMWFYSETFRVVLEALSGHYMNSLILATSISFID